MDALLHNDVVLAEQDLSGAMLGSRLNCGESMDSLLSPALLTYSTGIAHAANTRRAGGETWIISV